MKKMWLNTPRILLTYTTAMLILLGTLPITAQEANESYTWRVYTLDTGDYRQCTYSSIALDDYGNPHICYIKSQLFSDGKLNYTHWENGAWNTTTIDMNASSGRVSMALDGEDQPHISYDGKDNVGNYSAIENGIWTTETYSDECTYCEYSSIDVDAHGNPHVVFVCSELFGNGSLKYCIMKDGAWSSTEVDLDDSDDMHPCLRLDSNGTPHIAYYHSLTSTVRYARFNGITWDTETVDTINRSGLSLSLALNKLNNPCIAYYNSLDRSLRYASRESNGWKIQTVDDEEESKVSISLAFDSTDTPHIAYLVASGWFGGSLRYARLEGDKWYTTDLDEDINLMIFISEGTSLVLDQDDLPHIVYTNGAISNSLLYTTKAELPEADSVDDKPDDGKNGDDDAGGGAGFLLAALVTIIGVMVVVFCVILISVMRMKKKVKRKSTRPRKKLRVSKGRPPDA